MLLLLDTQHYGILIAQIFFGLWLVPLGYLAYRSSGMFPKWLGVLLILGGVCYLVDLLAAFLVPDVGNDPLLHRHPLGTRGNLDGHLPARDRREDREDRQVRTAHPRRGVNVWRWLTEPNPRANGCVHQSTL